MWRYISKQAYSRKFKNSSDSYFLGFSHTFGKTTTLQGFCKENPNLGISQNSIFSRVNGKIKHENPKLGMSKDSIVSRKSRHLDGNFEESHRNPSLGVAQNSRFSSVNGENRPLQGLCDGNSNLGMSKNSIFSRKSRHLGGMFEGSFKNHHLGFSQSLIFLRVKGDFQVYTSMGCGSLGGLRSYGSAAEAIASTSEEDIDEIQELIEEMNKENEALKSSLQPKQPKTIGGMGIGKYNILRRKQIKVETEAWEEAAKEYQELLMDMCEQKLAPNLPYMKSLFLGWFEPLRDAIAADQKLCDEGKNRGAYAPFFNELPAEMMAVITMHKLMGLLMTGGGTGSARVVQAASHIGEAIEHEVSLFPLRILKLLFIALV